MDRIRHGEIASLDILLSLRFRSTMPGRQPGLLAGSRHDPGPDGMSPLRPDDVAHRVSAGAGAANRSHAKPPAPAKSRDSILAFLPAAGSLGALMQNHRVAVGIGNDHGLANRVVLRRLQHPYQPVKEVAADVRRL